MLAVFDEGVARVSRVVADAGECERGWRERVRAGLEALLEFLDEQPRWARFLILESPVLLAERRQRALAETAQALERETRGQLSDATSFAPSARLTAELVVGGVFSVIRAQMLDDTARCERTAAPLVDLAPVLMAFVERPYRGGDCAADARLVVPVRRVTYRTGRVLGAIGAAPRSNNREIAEAAGLRDEGQTSKLLSRLERRGLLENVGLGAAYGEPNAWLLTASGERMLRAARRQAAADAGRVSAGRAIRGAA